MSDALLNLLDPSEVIAYRPALARALGSINAALFLCQAVYWHRIAKKMGNESFFKLMECEKDEDGNLLPPSSSHKQSWQWELGGMTRRQQEAARKILSDLNILYGIVRGTPAKLFYTINDAELEKFIINNQQFGENVQSSLAKRDNQDVPKSTIKNGENCASITESTPEINSENTAKKQSTPCVSSPPETNKSTAAGKIAVAMMSAGINKLTIKQHHPTFLALIAAGATIDEFIAAANQTVSGGKSDFAYSVGIVKRQREDAAKLVLHQGEMPDVAKAKLNPTDVRIFGEEAAAAFAKQEIKTDENGRILR